MVWSRKELWKDWKQCFSLTIFFLFNIVLQALDLVMDVITGLEWVRYFDAPNYDE